MNTYIQQFAELNGVSVSNGNWIQAICEAEGITQPVNGTWIEALARNKGATAPVNGSWIQALCYALGITNTVNGTWIAALAQSGLFLDSDAKSFVDAAGITNQTQINAIGYLVSELKAAGLWTKRTAIYPMVGGAVGSHKFNLKNPQDLDAAYRLSFSGTWTHSANGAKPNGAAGTFANTFINESTVMSQNNKSLTVYLSENVLNGFDIGNFNGSTNGSHVAPRQSELMYARCNDINVTTYANRNSMGFYASSRIASGQVKGYKNGVNVITSNTASNAQLNLTYYLGALNQNNVSALNSSRTIAYACIGEGLSDAEHTTLNSIVQTYQSILGRGYKFLRVTYEGNSFFASYNVPTNINTNLATFSYVSEFQNFAVNSASISNIIGNNNYMSFGTRVSAVDARYTAGANSVLVTFEGINDLVYQVAVNSLATSVTNTLNAIQSYATTQAGKGFKVIINTLTPRNTVQPNYEPARQNASDKYDSATVNGALRNIFDVSTGLTRVFTSSNPTWANIVLVDIGDDPNYGQAGQFSNTTWYDPDGIHPNATMSNDMAVNYYSPAIRYLF